MGTMLNFDHRRLLLAEAVSSETIIIPNRTGSLSFGWRLALGIAPPLRRRQCLEGIGLGFPALGLVFRGDVDSVRATAQGGRKNASQSQKEDPRLNFPM
jgi:hypothetical protein